MQHKATTGLNTVSNFKDVKINRNTKFVFKSKKGKISKIKQEYLVNFSL